jgi:hypothetical protein
MVVQKGVGQTFKFFLETPGKISTAGKSHLICHFRDITKIGFQ